MKLFVFLWISVSAWAQIELPALGVMLDENGRARRVTGAPAAAALGDSLFAQPVISLACSDQLCLAKTETAVISSAGDAVDAPPGAALMVFSGAAAYVYFIETQQFALWSGGVLNFFDLAPGADVVAMRANGFDLAVARDDGIWVGGQNLGAANAIFLLDGGGALLAASGQVRLLRADGTEVDFAVAGAGGFVAGFVRMSARYVEVITDNCRWALDTTPGQEQVFLLPGGSR